MKFPKPAGRRRDVDYMLLVKQLRCCAPGAPDECSGGIEADHAGERPFGRKADDDTCIPLCSRHHVQRTQLCGVFNWWTRDQMRRWLDQRIEETRALVKRRAA